MSQNYREIPALLSSRTPFEGNSMSAYVAHDGDYVVLSYNTEIARVTASTFQTEGEVILNEHKYSKTTSRHQNLCKENL